MTRCAVLGSPIAHSRSPVLHRAAYAELGLDWTYDAIEVGELELGDFIAACGPEWAGLSLTMPLKTVVLPMLTSMSNTARIVRAANTVVFTDDGLVGHNTDVPGIVRALASVGGPSVANEATVIGAGATARSALAALSRLGVWDADILVRRAGAAADLVDVAESLGIALRERDLHGDVSDALTRSVIISTVPGGAADHLVDQIPQDAGSLLDVNYSDWPTGLGAAWTGPTASGFDLLLWQAVDQVELMTGQVAPVEAMRRALEASGTI